MTEAAFTPIEQPRFTKAPTEPAWFFKRLFELGGTSPTGVPMLRVVWTEQAVKIFKGKTALAYPDTRDREMIGQNEHNNGKIIFHPAGREAVFNPSSLIIEPVWDWVDSVRRPHWVVELWTPASELGGWDEASQGPFPVRGVYQIMLHVSTPDRKYAPLNEDTFNTIRFFWQKLKASPVDNPYVENDVEQQDLRLAVTRANNAEQAKKDDAERLDIATQGFIEDRRRLHKIVRDELG